MIAASIFCTLGAVLIIVSFVSFITDKNQEVYMVYVIMNLLGLAAILLSSIFAAHENGMNKIRSEAIDRNYGSYTTNKTVRGVNKPEFKWNREIKTKEIIDDNKAE